MDIALGLIGLIVFVACVIAIAAGVTWGVVKLDQIVRRARQSSTPETPSS